MQTIDEIEDTIGYLANQLSLHLTAESGFDGLNFLLDSACREYLDRLSLDIDMFFLKVNKEKTGNFSLEPGCRVIKQFYKNGTSEDFIMPTRICWLKGWGEVLDVIMKGRQTGRLSADYTKKLLEEEYP